ncbi:uncharacterized protein PGTG_07355 [Puccinia graminis f. sp. tritici CRL 75-36-700-3]|uniref:Uncharacterized protein n=1 Tax=Puccinia graminis f. sp. tritici (strain CRL 75-36-700-3 / race SCCL) TaxID=418459 RepID=E3K9J5_PUCGT|nr:uncharacterized protein PGTG_07355 [Puccinia graminis f. sp. tritici CRL 75-36-700-3]EFP81103.2 hypothetical protein PGTG_07355 [Puccinia graminis f. sp. tritici CRL 75-36-700-3]
MAFSQNQDLEGALPTTNPPSTGIFSGNQNGQNMNIDPPPPPMSHNRIRHNRTYGINRHTQSANTSTGNRPGPGGNLGNGTYGIPAENEEPQEMDEPRPRPAVIIKEADLKYDGENFEDFLDRFELAAEIYGAGGFDKARQVCRFVKSKELKKELESMDGYDTRNWTILRASMMELWGGRSLDQKKGDGKKREKMVEENPPEMLQKQVDNLAKAIETLTGKLENQPTTEYSRGNERTTGRLYDPRPCAYCHREGHSTYTCYEAQKDEKEGIVKRDGRDFCLPNGDKIPWNPSRPIRTVVATNAAKPKPQINSVFRINYPASSEIRRETQEEIECITSLHKIEWEPPRVGSSSSKKIKLESNAATTRAEALRGRRKPPAEKDNSAMDVDQTDELEEIIQDIPATRKTPGQISDPQGKSTAQRGDKTVESELLSELDNLRIPTTFSQLTSISPTYAQEVIKKLQKRLPEHQNSKLTYVK